MIDEALIFLKDRLNAHLAARSGPAAGAAAEDVVVFVEPDKIDPIAFRLGAVSAMLVNVEEEKTLRDPDLFARSMADGTVQRAQPDIRLNLYLLFVVRFKLYEDGLRYLSAIIRYFQGRRVFDRRNAPELGEGIDRLVLELITLPLSGQNELWNALRTTYQPSVLYKVGLVVFRDEAAEAGVPVQELDLRTSP